MIRQTLCFIFIATFLCGCSFRHPYRNELRRADSIMADSPYTARNIIATIRPHEPAGEADRALYALLATEAAYRTNGSMPAGDSLINTSVRYFSRHNDTPHLIRSLLYKGVTIHTLGRHDEALRCIKEAEDMAIDRGDNTLRHCIYETLVTLNHRARCYNTMLKYSRLSLECAQHDGRPSWIAHSMMHMANSHAYLNSHDSARIYIDKLMPLLRKLPSRETARLYTAIGCLCHTVGNDDVRAKQLLRYALDIDNDPKAYKVLADIYFAERRYAKAEKLWQKAIADGDDELKASAYASVATLYEHTGQWKEALEATRKRMELKDHMTRHREKIQIAEIQLKYDNEKVKADAYRKLAIVLSLVVALLATLLLTIAYHRYKIREYRSAIGNACTQIKAYEKQIKMLRDSGIDEEKKVQKLQKKIDNIYKSISRQLSRGEYLTCSVEAGATMAGWSSEDITYFIDCYKIHNYDTVTAWENQYNNPTNKQMLYLILTDMSLSREKILHVLAINESSLRSIKSRLKARKTTAE